MKPKPKPKAKKRKPNDLTVRNAKAYNKKFKHIDQHLKAITLDIMGAFSRLDYLENMQRLKKVK